MDNEIESQIIEDGYNTSYIMSLITSLFYKSSIIDNILNIEPVDKKFVYAQEFIKIRFIDPLRRGYSIHSDSINEFRNYIMKCEWHDDVDEILKEHNIGEFYKYFMKEIYDNNLITFHRGGSNDKVGDISVPLIELNIPMGLDTVSLTDLFKNWLTSNVTMDKYNYNINKPPVLLPLYISRGEGTTLVDIKYKIKMFNVNDDLQDKISWTLQSLICYGDNGYYSIVRSSGKWIKVCDKNIPSLTYVDMYDDTDVKDISKDTVLVFYRLNQN